MPHPKLLIELSGLDLRTGWERPAGYPIGISRKILTSDLNEETATGSRTQLLRFEAGVFTTEPFLHDYWEEVLLIEGDLTMGSDAHGAGGQRHEPFAYAHRPPGTLHGPFASQQGCLLLEMQYYRSDNRMSAIRTP
jgi:hypothetical protein